MRVTVSDDLERSRLTVLFRLFLAIPHFVWWWLWTVAVVFVAVANWVVALVTGRPASGLANFTASYIRYWVHLFAYLYLAANPYPMFTGRPGYPVDCEFAELERQRRWVTALRLPLALPVLLLAAVFEGSGFYAFSGDKSTAVAWSGGTLLTVAFLAWFVCLVRGRMPSGFRDLQVYGLRFAAEVAAYVLILTERYPNADPSATPASGVDHPVWLRVGDDLRRSRLTVFFRLFLLLPHFVWLLLWWIAALPVAIVNWFATLVTGRPPRVFHRFLSAFVRYSTHLYAYGALTANPFPGFTGRAGSYPVDLVLPDPAPQRRLVTGFRVFLALPAFLVSAAVGGLLYVCAFLGWFASLALGRMPHSLHEAQAYALRYSAQLSAYLYLVTDRYPYSGPIRIPPRT